MAHINRDINSDTFDSYSTRLGTPAMAHSSLSEFTLFPKLPLEMRSMVWSKTLPPARAVLLRLERVPQNEDAEGSEEFRLASSCAIPIALKICRESRIEAKRHYHLGFANKNHEGRIYFDYSRDIVYLVWKQSRSGSEVDISPRTLHMLLDKSEVDKIEKMAVSSIYSETPQELVHFQNFAGLKELSVEFEAREFPDTRQVTLIEEEEFRMMNGQPPVDDMGILDRAFVLETFHEARKAFPKWKAPSLRFVSSGAEVVG